MKNYIINNQIKIFDWPKESFNRLKNLIEIKLFLKLKSFVHEWVRKWMIDLSFWWSWTKLKSHNLMDFKNFLQTNLLFLFHISYCFTWTFLFNFLIIFITLRHHTYHSFKSLSFDIFKSGLLGSFGEVLDVPPFNKWVWCIPGPIKPPGAPDTGANWKFFLSLCL